MYVKGLVNTKDQSNACMCEMMPKGFKEALTVLFVTHVTHVEREKVVFVACMQHCIQSNVTHLNHVKRVESVLCIKWPLTPLGGKALNAMLKGLKEIH